jgi:hypothetical protein
VGRPAGVLCRLQDVTGTGANQYRHWAGTRRWQDMEKLARVPHTQSGYHVGAVVRAGGGTGQTGTGALVDLLNRLARPRLLRAPRALRRAAALGRLFAPILPLDLCTHAQ